VLRVLFVGDVMGSPGRRVVSKLLRVLRSRLDAHLVIVNGENAAGGLGLTRPTLRNLLDSGADVITLGNHTFAKHDMYECLDDETRLIRPANYPPGVPGRGWGVFKASTGDRVAVANLLGRAFMNPVDCPFRAADAVFAEANGDPRALIVDMHAEATSEKKAMGWHLDGRASAVLGTHTHVQTSDEVILPRGTAYISDVGMTGVHDSVLGMDKDAVITRFTTQIMGKFVLAEGPGMLQGAVVDIDPGTGRATAIERVSVGEGEL